MSEISILDMKLKSYDSKHVKGKWDNIEGQYCIVNMWVPVTNIE